MDYGCGLAVDRIENQAKRRAFVLLSMALNLGMLGYFKYYNFFAASLHDLLLRGGLNVPLSQLEVVLPIGISFYTFQAMSYVIDVYRRDIKPTRNLIEFATFVSFFPHLVAGPIMRPTTLLPQVAAPRRFNLQQFYQGSYLIFWGLTKKVVVADNLASYVNDLFGRYETINGGLAAPGHLPPLRSRSTGTSQAIQTPPVASPSASGLSSRSTSTCPTSQRIPRSSGNAGTSASQRGCATISTSPSAETAAARSSFIAT